MRGRIGRKAYRSRLGGTSANTRRNPTAGRVANIVAISHVVKPIKLEAVAGAIERLT